MKLICQIQLDNAAFNDDPDELPRLLRNLAERTPDPIRETDGKINLHDINGNWVGFAEIVPGEIDG